MREMDSLGSSVPSRASTRTLRRGQHLYRPGETPACVYSVYGGTLKTYRISHDYREQISGFHFPGEMLGLDALLGRPVRCGAVALDTVVVYRFPAVALLKRTNQSAMTQLLERFGHEITRLEEHLSLDALSAEQRLAAFILWVVEKLSGRSPESTIRLPMSHKEIGNYLRLVPETVSRLLARFQERDCLSISGRELTLRNLDLLLHAAAGNLNSPAATHPSTRRTGSRARGASPTDI
ncbi:MAG: helix-turn-helix domain-containing protein [Gammaproteobacteria bacterium]